MTAHAQAWYAGTNTGLLRVERGLDGHASTHLLGLQNAGGFRTPVVVDCADPTRLYAGTTRAGMFRSDDAGQTWREINQGITPRSVAATTPDNRGRRSSAVCWAS